jgi:DnaJ like chaperone protein
MLLIFICAFLGLWLAGAPGFIMGGALGYLLSRVMQASAYRGLHVVQSQFIESTFAVMGALCKADGVVTRDEIQVTEQLFARLQLSPEQKATAKAAFNRGKAPEFDLEAEVDAFVQSAEGGAVLFQLFLQVQVAAVAADGEVHPAEHAMLVRVARRMGLSERDVAQLEALLRAAAGGPATAGAPPTQQRLEDAYTALGVTPDASASDIKRAYRKLISENHPDKLAAKGLPENMRKIAEERAREINAAYDLLKKARQFT